MRYIECGCCGQYHRADYWGDCRNDEERFNLEDIPNDAEIISLEELDDMLHSYRLLNQKEEEEEEESDKYDCPIHGLQDGPDCPRC